MNNVSSRKITKGGLSLNNQKDSEERKSEEDVLKPYEGPAVIIVFIILGTFVGSLLISIVIQVILYYIGIENPGGIDEKLLFGMIMGSVVVLILKFVFVFWIYNATLVRGMPSPITWSLMAMFFTIIALILYFLNSPEGKLVDCHVCGSRKHEILYECPHCKVRKDDFPKKKTRRIQTNC